MQTAIAENPTAVRARCALSLAALIALWLLFLWPAFDSDRSFALWMDNEFFIGPVLSAMSKAFAHGEWPLRMNTILGGVPLHNFAQLSPFYPFYLAELPLFKDPVWATHSMHWLVLGHLLILEINMFVLLSTVGTTRIAAITGAALFAFSANSFSYAAWLNIVAPYSWLPLYLAGLVGLLSDHASKRHFVMALAGMVLLVLASPAQPLIHAILLTGVFLISYTLKEGRAIGPRGIGARWGRVSMVAVCAMLLAAPVIVPIALEFKDMIRWIGEFPPVVGNAPIPFEAFQVDQLAVSDLGGAFFKFNAAAVGNPFVGLAALALASVALVSRPRSWLTGALLFIAIYALLSSTGGNLGFAHLNHAIPILNKIREPSRFLVLFQLAIAVLTAIGIDQLRQEMTRDKASRRLLRRQLAAMAVAAVIGLFVAVASAPRIISSFPPAATLALLLAFMAVTVLIARSSTRAAGDRVAVLWSVAAVVFLLADVHWVPQNISTSFYNAPATRQLDVALDRVGTLDPTHDYRVIFDGKIDKQLASMLASYKGIRTLNAYFNPAPKAQFDELYYHQTRPDNYFPGLGARYLVCDACSPDAARGYVHREDIAGLQLYENDAALPHAYALTHQDGVVGSLNEYAARTAPLDLRRGILFTESSAPAVLPLASGDAPSMACPVKEKLPRRMNRIEVEVENCAAPSVLVLNEFFSASWKATVDRQPAELLRVNGNQMGVKLQPGTHNVRLRYLPATFAWSLPLSALGLIVALGWLLFSGRKRRTGNRTAATSA